MAHDVFISYAPENKTLVDGVVNYLESNGIRCWFAPRDIRPGESRMVAIPTAIRKSQVFILAFTGKANDSQNVSREVNLALESGAVVIPLRFEDVMPGDTLSYALSGVHWLDAMTEPMDVHLQLLTDQVVAHLQHERPDGRGPARHHGPAAGPAA